MLRRLLYGVSGRLRCKTIRGDAELPYMERYFLFDKFGYRVYLHRFLGGDAEEAVHDHPWQRASALVLTGRYEEHRSDFQDGEVQQLSESRFVRRAGRFNRLRGDTLHRIARTEPETWTLFWHSREKIKPWGFLQQDDSGRYSIVPHKSSHQANWECYQPKARDLPDRADYRPRHLVPKDLLISE